MYVIRLEIVLAQESNTLFLFSLRNCAYSLLRGCSQLAYFERTHGANMVNGLAAIANARIQAGACVMGLAAAIATRPFRFL